MLRIEITVSEESESRDFEIKMITDLARFIFAMLLQSFKYTNRFQYFTLRPVSTKETIIKETEILHSYDE